MPSPRVDRGVATAAKLLGPFALVTGLLVMAATPASSTSGQSPPANTGNQAVLITSPSDGSTFASGTAVTLVATVSTDVRAALQTGTDRACFFTVGDDARTTVTGAIDVNAGTCTASWTYNYSTAFSVTGWIQVPGKTSYGSAPITLNVTGGTNPRCTGRSDAPATCVYRWVEAYYNSGNTRAVRVCAIDGGCQWQTTHTAWTQVSNSAYWVNSTGRPLADGNQAEAYLCLGSSPSAWSAYSSNHSFDTLVSQSATSADPVSTSAC